MRPFFVSSIIMALAAMISADSLSASSHMDAPLITLDPAANTTDVYSFVADSPAGKSLVVALSVYPHEEPGIGPNKYNFDDEVLYEIHVALGSDVSAGRKTVSYQWRFQTEFRDTATILQSYLGPIEEAGDANQNLVQRYTITKVDHRDGSVEDLTHGRTTIVPPNNQGIATPFYNRGDDGERPAREGVDSFEALDRYTKAGIIELDRGYLSFAGQRDDGFYADIQSIFDLLSLRDPGKDSQGGFNLHMMALRIPVAELGGDQQIVGVYATTSRKKVRVLRDPGDINGDGATNIGDAIRLVRSLFHGNVDIVDCVVEEWVQVGRQGNPLFNEGFVAIEDKDRYSRTSPERDRELFEKYALEPELAFLINEFLLGGSRPEITTDRTDIAGIYIPDLIKTDLSTVPARLAGSGPEATNNPDDRDYSRLGIFGGDVLISQVQDPFGLGGAIPGGWPNGRRFGDDVVDIAIDAVLSDLRVVPPVVVTFEPGDGVDRNDISFNKVFPYEGTPLNGRTHDHP